jgi:hypothetical protein
MTSFHHLSFNIRHGAKSNNKAEDEVIKAKTPVTTKQISVQRR